jgi:cupin-like protein
MDISFLANWSPEQLEILIGSESPDDAAKMLSSLGEPQRAITAGEVQDLCGHPLVEYARKLSRAHRKMIGLLDALSELQRLAGPPEIIAQTPNREQFIQRYYLTNRPFLLKGAMSSCAAAKTWSPSFLKERYGEEEIEVMMGRENNNITSELDPDNYRTRIKMKEFVARIEGREPTNELYLTAHNRIFENPAFSDLLDDLPKDLPFLSSDTTRPKLFNLWVGPAGTITHLHHDTASVFVGQFFGSKKVLLVPAIELHRISNMIGVYSSLNLSDPVTLDSIREVYGANVYELTLEPGDAVLIPMGWWHYIEALTTSISVTFHGLNLPKSVRWKSNFWMHGPAIWKPIGRPNCRVQADESQP